MKLSYNWLNEFVDVSDIDPYEMGLRLTMATSEIEGVEKVGSELRNIVVGKILDVKPHPDSDHLFITKVDVGNGTLQIVSGAPNTKKDSYVPVALVGAELPSGMKVKKAKLRGVESYGVVCSEKELGISDDHSGLWILNEEDIDFAELKPGVPISKLFPSIDYIIEIDNKSLTNRPDLWSHYGFARELSAIYGKKLKPIYPDKDFKALLGYKGKSPIDVEIIDKDLCPRYSAIVFEGVKIKKSPYFVRRRLFTLGVRPISNMVDVTNWVMLEVGQPLHAFDASKIEGNRIIVRRAKNGEIIETLDGVERILNENMLVIADVKKAIALAGVMGGANTEVDDSTTKIVVEAANFNPVSIRRTAVAVGLRTEASNRFEKSIAPDYTIQGLTGTVRLLTKLSPEAKIISPLLDKDYTEKTKITIPLNLNWVNRMLGMNLERERVIKILKSLQFKVEVKDDNNILVTVPSFRATKDVSIPQDLVEEVGRIFGYDNIPPELPLIQTTPPPKDDLLFFMRRIKKASAEILSLTEVYTYSFQEDRVLDLFYSDKVNFVTLKNPVGSHLSRMRRSLIPGLYSLIDKNISFRDEIEIFEVGSVYNPDKRIRYKAGELPEERKLFSSLFLKTTGRRPLFFYAKGKLEALFNHLYIENVEILRKDQVDWEKQWFDLNSIGDLEAYHPARLAFLIYNGEVFGFIGELNPKLLKAIGIDFNRKRASVFEIDLMKFLEIAKLGEEKKRYRSIPKFPEVALALAVVVDESVPAKEVFDFIRSYDSRLLKRVELFDIYRGKPLPEGRKNIAFNLYYGVDERTLTEKEANVVHESIAESIRQHGWELR